MNIKEFLLHNKITSPAYRFLWKIKIAIPELSRRITYRKELKSLKQFKGIHAGKRCFVIGNGPSLTATDLDQLSGEYCFASNRIYKVFSKTKWRPSYYSVCERKLFTESEAEILALSGFEKFIPMDFIQDKKRYDGFHYFSRIPFSFFHKYPNFSSKAHSRLFEGGTVTYFLLQLAVYFGFTEIYLLGCDFNYSITWDDKGNVVRDASVKNYFYEGKQDPATIPNLALNLKSYHSARRYADAHGIGIYNATRGGKLEVFERKSFDSLFQWAADGGPERS